MSEFKKVNDENLEESLPLKEEIINSFTKEPTFCICRFCNKKILTDIETEYTWTGIIISGVIFMLFKLLSIPLIILACILTQETTHKCPNCLNKIGTSNFYDYISLSDKIFKFQLGTNAVIITRKMLLSFFVFVLISIITIFLFFDSSDNFFNASYLDEKWESFIKDCKNFPYEKTTSIKMAYCQMFEGSNISWNGHVVRTDYEGSFISKHRISILVKMNKNDTSEDGDLYLKLNESKYEENKKLVFDLSRGDHIYFNATILKIDRGIIIAEGFEIDKISDSIIINPHIHHSGRYSFDKSKHDHDHNHNHNYNNNVNKIISADEVIFNELSDFKVAENIDFEKQKETYH